MFGHQDDEQAEPASAATAPVAASDHNSNQQSVGSTSSSATSYFGSLGSETLDQDHPEAGAPTSSSIDSNDSSSSISSDSATSSDTPAAPSSDFTTSSSDDHAIKADDDDVVKPAASGSTRDTPLVNDDLLNIKQQALGELSPLVDHLDQTPEEKFKTTMMMIQAADNQSLIPDAYKAAKAINDEKARAQALLDIVNEINYFTAQK